MSHCIKLCILYFSNCIFLVLFLGCPVWPCFCSGQYYILFKQRLLSFQLRSISILEGWAFCRYCFKRGQILDKVWCKSMVALSKHRDTSSHGWDCNHTRTPRSKLGNCRNSLYEYGLLILVAVWRDHKSMQCSPSRHSLGDRSTTCLGYHGWYKQWLGKSTLQRTVLLFDDEWNRLLLNDFIKQLWWY